MFTSYADVFDYYKKQAVWFTNLTNGLILKTDCFNEANNRSVATKDMILVEIDPAIIAQAREDNPDLKILHADIRSLPFGEEMFDGIMDLSTLDHIPEYDEALREYYRVLKPDGLLLLYTWIGDKNTFDEWESTQQYYFNMSDILDALSLFTIESDQAIFEDRAVEGAHLHEFICRR